MRKYLIFCFLLLSLIHVNGQSKKTQIKTLTIQVDSINAIVSSQANYIQNKDSIIQDLFQKVNYKKSEIDSLNNVITNLDNKTTVLVQEKNSIINENAKLTLNIDSIAESGKVKINGFLIPLGSNVVLDYDNKVAKNVNDFDGDGKDDLAVICEKSDSSGYSAIVYLTSKYSKNHIYSIFSVTSEMTSITFENNNLVFSSSEGNGRHHTILTFKYISRLNDMMLTEYSIGYLGNYVFEGVFEKSIAFNINNIHTYNISGVKKNKKGKIQCPIITLSTVERYLEFLRDFESENY
jgi:hypothetical protein